MQIAAYTHLVFDSHRKYSDKLNLPFALLTDANKAVCQLYDVRTPVFGIQRTVFVIAKDGTILYREKGAPKPADIIKDLNL